MATVGKTLFVVLAVAGWTLAKEPAWVVASALGIGSMDMEEGDVNMSLSLDVKRHYERTEWVGASLAMHQFQFGGSSYRNTPNQYFAFTPTYSRILMGRFAHAGVTTGLGVYLLRENTNLSECYGGYGWYYGSEDTGPRNNCWEGPNPADVWTDHMGLRIPLAAQVGVHFGALGAAFQPEIGGMIPMTDRFSLRPWFQFQWMAILVL